MHYVFVALDRVHEELGTGHVVRVSRILDSMCSQDSPFKDFTIQLFSNNLAAIQKFAGSYVEDVKTAQQLISTYIDYQKVDVIFFDCLDYFSDIYEECNSKNIISIGMDVSEQLSDSLSLCINPVIKNKNAYLNGPMYSLHYESSIKKFENFQERKNHIFICFGGLDFQDHLLKLIPCITEIPSIFQITIVVSQPKDLNLSIALSENITLLYKPVNFFELLNSASLALISGGILLQEAVYLGVPALIFPQYQHQYEAGIKMKDKGACIDVFPLGVDYRNVFSSFQSYLSNTSLLQQVSIEGRASDDGFGGKRILNALQIYEYLEWDSIFFKKNIYSITSKCYSDRIKSKLDPLIENQSIDLIYFLCPGGDQKSIKNANSDGFTQVDQRLTYLIKASSYEHRIFQPAYSPIRSMDEDSKELANLAKSIKWTTRYTNDKKFDPILIEKFYEEWVIKSIAGKLDDAVYHIQENDEILGFISIKKMGINMGSIGLVGVAPSKQGRGVGIALTNFAVNLMLNTMSCASVQVVTQSDNIGACKTYEKIGFHPSDYSLWFHKWIAQ